MKMLEDSSPNVHKCARELSSVLYEYVVLGVGVCSIFLSPDGLVLSTRRWGGEERV